MQNNTFMTKKICRRDFIKKFQRESHSIKRLLQIKNETQQAFPTTQVLAKSDSAGQRRNS